MTHALPADLLRFYQGTGGDSAGRSIEDVLRLDWVSLECTHDYIQWLFALFSRSAFVPDAPVLDTATAEAMRADPVVRANVLRAFRSMLDFYGFVLDDDDPDCIVVEESPLFPVRSPNWLAPDNHNLRRITRILTSLQLLGLAPYAHAFFECLDLLYRARGGRIGLAAHRHWRSAVAG